MNVPMPRQHVVHAGRVDFVDEPRKLRCVEDRRDDDVTFEIE
jgi:hypothetical protein